MREEQVTLTHNLECRESNLGDRKGDQDQHDFPPDGEGDLHPEQHPTTTGSQRGEKCVETTGPNRNPEILEPSELEMSKANRAPISATLLGLSRCLQ